MALRLAMPRSKALSADLLGHFSVHRPQPVHLALSTHEAFRRILTLKLPTYPPISSISEYVQRVILGCLPASTILGVRMHWEQSRVGKVSDSWAMCPPMDGSRSTKMTG